MSISRRNTRLVIVSQFLSALIFTIPIWIPYYRQAITISQISFLISFQYAIQLLLELPTGAFADLFGRKVTVAIGYVALALSSLVLISAPDFTVALIATVFAGISEAMISGALEALVYDSYKQDGNEQGFRTAMSANGFWYQIALAIGTFGGGFLYQIWHGLPYLLHGGITLVATVVSMLCIEPQIDSMKFTLRNYLRQIRDGARHAFHSRPVALMSLFYITVAGITWTNQLYFNSFMLVDLGFSDQMRSLIGGGQRLFNVFILRNLLKNDRFFTRERSILFFPVLMLVSFLPGVFYRGWWAIPLVTLALMAGTARWLILTKYTNEMFDSRYRATAISALSMIIGVIYIVITFVSGPIIEFMGGVRTMYTVLGLLTLCTVLPLSFIVINDKNR